MGLSRKQVGDRVIELMTEVGIPEPKSRVDAYPHELVGRAAAARDDRNSDRLRAEAA